MNEEAQKEVINIEEQGENTPSSNKDRKSSLWRKVAISVTIFFTLIILICSTLFALIATPQFLTPKVLNIAKEYVKSDISIKSVDISLFSRFPNLTLKIDSLQISQTKDSIDNLLFAKECRVAINPFGLLTKKLVVSHLSLSGTNIYLYVDSLNRPIDHFRLPEESADSLRVETQDSLATSEASSDFGFLIKRVKIDSANLIIDDRIKNFYSRVSNYNLKLTMKESSDNQTDLEVRTGFDNLLVWNNGEILVKKTRLNVRSKMNYQRDSMKLSFEKAGVHLNGIGLRSTGSLRRDTTSHSIVVDINSTLSTPSLTEFLALIPESVINNKEEITTEGSVKLDLKVAGEYSDTSYPTVTADIKIDDAKARYESRKVSLESVNCDATLFLDLNNPALSYSDIKNLHINSTNIINIDLSGKMTNILEDPYVDARFKSTIDFNKFSEVFPIKGGVICSGYNQSDIKAKFRVKDIEEGNYAKLIINGESTFKDLELSYDASKFIQDSSNVAYFYMQAQNGSMLFGDKVRPDTDSRTLLSTINFSGLGYKSKTGEHLKIKDIKLTAGANFDRKTSQINGIGIRGIAQNTIIGVDSLFNASFESSDVTFYIAPKSKEREMMIAAKISSKQILAKEPTYNSHMSLSTVNMDLSTTRIERRNWHTTGDVGFADLEMYTDLFPLNVEVPETSVSVDGRTIRLNNAHLALGESEIVATGEITNLIRKMFFEPKETLSGNLAINSSKLHISEIMEASNRSVMMLEEEQNSQQADSTLVAQNVDSLQVAQADESALFLVPRRVNFIFNLNIDQAIFEDAAIDDVVGRAVLKKGVLTLDKLTLKAIGGEANGSMIYKNLNRKSANIALNMDLSRVDINRIGELSPSINSMFPMLNSFQGIVDLELKANTDINEDSMIDFNTLRSAIAFHGDNLVLMDSETFADLSKTLMFKNKKRNLIDALTVYATVDKTKVVVLPFSMTIDRYRAYIGGSQVINPETFDVDYKYNISIIRSPLPFKAGVDIWGDLNDFDFKVTSAKLKKTDFKAQKKKYEDYRDSIK